MVVVTTPETQRCDYVIRRHNQKTTKTQRVPAGIASIKPFENDENAFYFTLKALFVRKIFKFSFWLSLFIWEYRLIKKVGLISKSMTPSIGKQIFTIHILPNISISKDNQEVNKTGRLVPDLFLFF